MIVKILGLLDIFVGLVFWLFGIFHIIPSSFVLILGLFLLAKGIIFITGFSVGSFLDIISAIIIITATGIEIPKLIVIIVCLFLLQKGIFSLAG
tara:strand:- start:237 stop:518 length:282 start_codon:yes stop_codon:yes gene_type:complete